MKEAVFYKLYDNNLFISRLIYVFMAMPDRTPSDFFSSRWAKVRIPEGKKIESLDDLKNVLPYGDAIEMLRINDNYSVYGLPGKAGYLAYKCEGCSKLIVGIPRIEDDLSIEQGMSLAERKGYDVLCGNCGYYLDGETSEQICSA